MPVRAASRRTSRPTFGRTSPTHRTLTPFPRIGTKSDGLVPGAGCKPLRQLPSFSSGASMPVVTACSSCNTRLRLPDNLPETTRVVRCPRCGASVPVPTPVTVKAPAPVITPVPVPIPVPTSFACPHCKAEVACDHRLAGRVVACPHCQGQFQMPGTPAAVQSYPPPPPSPAPVEPVVQGARRRQAAPTPGRRGWVIGTLSGIAGILAVVLLLMLVLPSSASGLGDEVRYFPEDTRIIASFDVGGTLRSMVWKKMEASKLFR